MLCGKAPIFLFPPLCLGAFVRNPLLLQPNPQIGTLTRSATGRMHAVDLSTLGGFPLRQATARPRRTLHARKHSSSVRNPKTEISRFPLPKELPNPSSLCGFASLRENLFLFNPVDPVNPVQKIFYSPQRILHIARKATEEGREEHDEITSALFSNLSAPPSW